MKECLISVDLANAIRSLVDVMKLKVPEGDLGFTCKECGKPVKPFQGGMQGPHFEHLERNDDCSLSDT
jgi:competence CoiA-like predicted nuclease